MNTFLINFNISKKYHKSLGVSHYVIGIIIFYKREYIITYIQKYYNNKLSWNFIYYIKLLNNWKKTKNCMYKLFPLYFFNYLIISVLCSHHKHISSKTSIISSETNPVFTLYMPSGSGLDGWNPSPNKKII